MRPEPESKGKARVVLLLAGLLLWAPVPVAGEGRPGDPERGKAVYLEICAACHGPGGKGDGPRAPGLPVRPRDHTDPSMNALSDAHLYRVIKEGGGAVGKSPLMLGYGSVLSEEEIWDLVAYLRLLARPAGSS